MTVYNFYGLVEGSAKSPAGWEFSSEEFGRTPTLNGYPMVLPVLVTSRLVSPKLSAMSQTGTSMPIKPPEWITGRSFVPWAMPKGRVSKPPAEPRTALPVTPCWRENGFYSRSPVSGDTPQDR